MRKFLPFIVFIFITSCDEKNSPRQSVTENEIEFTLVSKSNTVESPRDLALQFSIKNHRDSTVAWQFGSLCQVGYRIRTAEGKVIAEFPERCGSGLSALVLTAGANFSYQFDSLEGQQLNPGAYAIEVFLRNNHSPVLTLNIRIENTKT